MGGTGGGFKPGSCQILRFSGRGSGVFEVFGGIELEVHGEMGGSVGFYPFFDKLEVVGVVEDDGEFIEGFDFDGEEEGPLGFWVDVAAGADVEDFGDFEEETAGVADEVFEDGGADLRLELEEDDVMDHPEEVRISS
jgi:hypothetical protein